MNRPSGSPEISAAIITVIGTLLVSIILGYLEGRVGFASVLTIGIVLLLAALLYYLHGRAGPRVTSIATGVMLVAGFIVFLATRSQTGVGLSLPMSGGAPPNPSQPSVAPVQPSSAAPTIASLTRAIQDQPAMASLYVERGELYYNDGDYRRAIDDYTKAAELRPFDASIYSRLGHTYQVMGDNQRALDNFTKAIEYQANEWAYLDRGDVYLDQGDLDNAINDFSDAIRLQFDFARAYYRRGYAYRLKRENDKAMADYEKFLELETDPDLRREVEEYLRVLRSQ
jgi:tetratricopeptide (TPR) repeat protein